MLRTILNIPQDGHAFRTSVSALQLQMRGVGYYMAFQFPRIETAPSKSAESIIQLTEVMKNRFRQLFISLICIFTIVQSLTSQEPKAGKPKQYIYVLKLVPRLYADSAWTKEDTALLQRHFVRFQDAAKSGQLILAGRTSEPGDKTFGIAIFEASDEDAARKFMQDDPAVAGGLMTAELHPFAVALQRKNP
jgi:uncharacterized protein YciI